MSEPVQSLSSILVDVELPDPVSLSPELVDELASLRVVLLGWYTVPEQTSPRQAREQFEEEAGEAFDTVIHQFEEAGAEVETFLVFTGNKFDTISRITQEENCDAVLLPGPMEHLRRVLVPLRGLHNVDRIAPFVADLVKGATVEVTLLHVLQEGETEEDARDQVLGPVTDRLTGLDMDEGLIEHLVVGGDPSEVVVDVAENYDLVVLGETKPTVREILFGTVPERIVETSQVPVILVRHKEEDVEMVGWATR